MSRPEFITVYSPGSIVGIALGIEDVMAKVLAVQIKPDGVTYRVAWWNGRQRLEDWVEACEVRPPRIPEQTAIGFHQETHR